LAVGFLFWGGVFVFVLGLGFFGCGVGGWIVGDGGDGGGVVMVPLRWVVECVRETAECDFGNNAPNEETDSGKKGAKRVKSANASRLNKMTVKKRGKQDIVPKRSPLFYCSEEEEKVEGQSI
jgi:hypothetical protein